MAVEDPSDGPERKTAEEAAEENTESGNETAAEALGPWLRRLLRLAGAASSAPPASSEREDEEQALAEEREAARRAATAAGLPEGEWLDKLMLAEDPTQSETAAPSEAALPSEEPGEPAVAAEEPLPADETEDPEAARARLMAAVDILRKSGEPETAQEEATPTPEIEREPASEAVEPVAPTTSPVEPAPSAETAEIITFPASVDDVSEGEESFEAAQEAATPNELIALPETEHSPSIEPEAFVEPETAVEPAPALEPDLPSAAQQAAPEPDEAVTETPPYPPQELPEAYAEEAEPTLEVGGREPIDGPESLGHDAWPEDVEPPEATFEDELAARPAEEVTRDFRGDLLRDEGEEDDLPRPWSAGLQLPRSWFAIGAALLLFAVIGAVIFWPSTHPPQNPAPLAESEQSAKQTPSTVPTPQAETKPGATSQPAPAAPAASLAPPSSQTAPPTAPSALPAPKEPSPPAATINPQKRTAALEVLARKGDARAENELGTLYARGDGVPQDLHAAAHWFRAAALKGYAGAQYNLGQLYQLGLGLPANPIEAYKWYKLAARGGSESAAERIDELDKALSPAQLATANKAYQKALAELTGKPRTRTAAKAESAVAEETEPLPAMAAASVEKSPRATTTHIQRILDMLGYEPGPADGIMRAKTAKAIRLFQRDVGLPVNGRSTPALFVFMLAILRYS
jgi:TPR repeat protein